MSIENVQRLRGSTVVDSTGARIGTVEEIYLDEQTDKPEWMLVNTGLFGKNSTFIPLQGATPQADTLQVPFDKAQISGAPEVAPDRQLSKSEEAELYRYYGLSLGTADDATTRSQEQPPAGTASQEAARARLRKRVGTDEATASDELRGGQIDSGDDQRR